MTDETFTTIKREQRDVAETRTKPYSFSDALEHIVEVVTQAKREPCLVPADRVLGVLPGTDAPSWVLIDSHNGRHVRCSVCNATSVVPVNSFATYLKGIGAFIDAHRGCGT